MSSNLALDQVLENQALKEVTINTATGQLDAALTESRTETLAAGNVTVSDTNYRRAIRIYATGVATSGRTLTVPQLKKLCLVSSDAANSNNITLVRGTTTLVMAPGSVALIYTDGSANGMTVIASGGATKPYDVGTFIVGLPVVAELLLRYNFARAVTWLANMAGSVVTADIAATAQTDFTVKINGATVGTIRFAAAAITATFIGFSAINIVAGDILTITAPGTQDASLADISFTLVGAQV